MVTVLFIHPGEPIALVVKKICVKTVPICTSPSIIYSYVCKWKTFELPITYTKKCPQLPIKMIYTSINRWYKVRFKYGFIAAMVSRYGRGRFMGRHWITAYRLFKFIAYILFIFFCFFISKSPFLMWLLFEFLYGIYNFKY